MTYKKLMNIVKVIDQLNDRVSGMFFVEGQMGLCSFSPSLNRFLLLVHTLSNIFDTTLKELCSFKPSPLFSMVWCDMTSLSWVTLKAPCLQIFKLQNKFPALGSLPDTLN